MSVLEIPGVQRPIFKHARATGWKVVWKMKIEGRRGCPDGWFLRNGKWVIMEFKRPGGELSESQKRRIRELRENGQEVFVIDNAAEGIALLDGAFDEDLL